MSIGINHSEELYKYITGIIENKSCKLLAINGIPNHIHILFDLSPIIALADLVRDVKRSSSKWMKESRIFPLFDKWCEGYFAASVSVIHKKAVIDYIMGQREHHQNLNYEDEFKRLIIKNGMTKYLNDLE